MEFITTTSAPPPLPPPQKQYQSRAIINLTTNDRRSLSRRGSSAAGDDKPGLIRTISRGSLGRRSSTGAGGESVGGGLRRVLSRGDKSGATDAQGRRSSDGSVLKHGAADATPDAGGQPLQRTKSVELKLGKWVSPVMAGVAGNSLVLTLAVDSVLVPFGSGDHQAKPNAAAGPSATSPTTTGTEAHSGSGGGIGATIKKIFRRASSSQQGTSAQTSDAHATSATSGAQSAHSDETAVNAPLSTLEGHHQLTEQKQEKAFPAYVHGEPVKYVVVPLAALDYKTITIKEDKGVFVVKVPVTSHFGRFVEPALADIGKPAEEGWGRSGEIEFLFDSKDWIGAKDEAELLHFSLMNALNPVTV